MYTKEAHLAKSKLIFSLFIVLKYLLKATNSGSDHYVHSLPHGMSLYTLYRMVCLAKKGPEVSKEMLC